jgi:2-polyprenyl-6-methoxyphenol hydroxylase-like FAD-dependent oxidoreductase
MRDVLVVGAGPVGLTMAAELARHGASCRVVDQLAAPLPYCRAVGVTPRTLEVWDDMGIVRSMIDAGLWLTGTRSIVHGAQMPDTIRTLSDLPYGHLGIRQSETERLLTAHLANFGIAVERPVTLIGLGQNGDAVEAELLHADQSTERAVFRYVVGCDGAHSVVRRQSGIPFEGDQFPVGFMLGDVMFDCDLPRGMALRSINPHEGSAPDFFVAIPLPERNRYRVSMLAPIRSADAEAGTDHGLQTDRPAPTLEELQTVADRLLPTKVTMSDLQWSSNFRISMRLAARYREGRCFLAGDAAHIHPPTGGQGMNTGIQDAYNLAWKMALVLKGATSPSLLDTYEEERRPVGADVVARTRRASEQFGRAESTQDERLADTQILIHYRGSALSSNVVSGSLEDLPVQAGDRAPDCLGLRRENVRSPFRLFDLTRGIDSVLLYYVGQTLESEQIELLERIARELKTSPGQTCRLLAIGSADAILRDIVGVPTIIDAAGEFAAAYSPAVHTGYLIRPDGYVGYHARPVTEHGLLAYLAGPVHANP